MPTPPGLPARIPPLKSEMSLHIAVMAARRDAPQVPLMKQTWPGPRRSWIAVPGSPPCPLRPPGWTRLPAASGSGQTSGRVQTRECARGSGRGGRGDRRGRQPGARGSRSPPRGGLHASLRSGSSSATGSKWKDCKPYTPRDPRAPSGPNSLALARCCGGCCGRHSRTSGCGGWGPPDPLPPPGDCPPEPGFLGLLLCRSLTPSPIPWLTPGCPSKPCLSAPLAGMATVFQPTIPLPSQRPYSARLEPPQLEIHAPWRKLKFKREGCISGLAAFPKTGQMPPRLYSRQLGGGRGLGPPPGVILS